MRALKAFVAGAGTAYFLDPRQGKRRRHVLRDRTLRAGRRARRLGVRKARFLAGHLHGLLAMASRPLRPRPPAGDDVTVLQRVRSDALREAGVSKRDVEVDIERGLAIVRGSVPTREQADELVSRVRKVPGVKDVAAMLHVGDRAEIR